MGAFSPASGRTWSFMPAWESTCMVTFSALAAVTGTVGSVPPATATVPTTWLVARTGIGAEFPERQVHHPAGFLGALDIGKIVIVILGIAQSVENQD
jgi:hypothetical protein